MDKCNGDAYYNLACKDCYGDTYIFSANYAFEHDIDTNSKKNFDIWIAI